MSNLALFADDTSIKLKTKPAVNVYQTELPAKQRFRAMGKH